MTHVYREREFYSLDGWTVGNHVLKVYGISVPVAARLESELIEAARSHTERVLPPAATTEGGSERLGYCVLHRGELGTWLLINWWVHGDICCGRLALAATGSTQFEALDARPLLACVWEQVVMHHERDAWVRHMMSAAPDPAAYRQDRLTDGLY